MSRAIRIPVVEGVLDPPSPEDNLQKTLRNLFRGARLRVTPSGLRALAETSAFLARPGYDYFPTAVAMVASNGRARRQHKRTCRRPLTTWMRNMNITVSKVALYSTVSDW